ncbi:MAG: hypothetical protein MI740_08660 [Halanaerobiales bacterium]|nr:hypothetical protein [Halanaerobiales bacterium]
MIMIMFFVLAVLFLSSRYTFAATYYASPSGGYDGQTKSRPFQIADFWEVAKPGDTLILLDGRYIGWRSMIVPPETRTIGGKERLFFGGLPGNPITIQALNDGKVEIDGEKKSKPISLRGKDYFVIEGVNAHSAGGTNNASVVSLSRSNYNIIRRVCGWDAKGVNDYIFAVNNGDYNLFEDCAGWGIARKTYSSSQNGNHTTVRRCWGRWDGCHHIGPKLTLTMVYNNRDMTIENCIMSWGSNDLKEIYNLECREGMTDPKCGTEFRDYSVDQPYGIYGIDRMDGDDKNARAKLLGSIAYIRSNDRFQAKRLVFAIKLDSIEITDTVAYIEPGSHLEKRTFELRGLKDGVAQNLTARNITSIGGAGSSIDNQWQVSNLDEGATVAEVGSIYNNPRGAKICKRYENGVLTNKRLWPWPMDQRIYDAMILSGREPFYVTQTIESMFGVIPKECRWDH